MSLRHGTLSLIILLYVLLPRMAGQIVVQMRVPEISLLTGYRPKIDSIFAVNTSIENCCNNIKSLPPLSFIYGGAKRAGMGVYSVSPSAKLRTRPQSNRTYITWSVMQPASCRFTLKVLLQSTGLGRKATGLALLGR